MCGRFALKISPRKLAEMFGLEDEPPKFPPRYNISPGQDIAAIVATEHAARRGLAHFLWGLTPGWSKEPVSGLINARCETAAEKPAFREAFRRRRCLIPADGFYEWRAEKGHKQPYFFSGREGDGGCLAMGGLWEMWRGAGGEVIRSCAILTTVANGVVSAVHDRMPVIVSPEAFDRWLDPLWGDTAEILKLCQPYRDDLMQIWPVSSAVNNPKIDTPACCEPISPPPTEHPEKGLFDS